MKLPASVQHIKTLQSTVTISIVDGKWAKTEDASESSLEQQFDEWYSQEQPDVTFVSPPSVVRYGDENVQITTTAVSILYVPAYIDSNELEQLAQGAEPEDPVQPATDSATGTDHANDVAGDSN